MEADLARYYGLDLRDLWRPGRTLTHRRAYALIKHLPADSATAIAQGGHGWTLSDYLLADLFRLWSEDPHPADPRAAKKQPQRPDGEAVRAARARHAARRRRLGITGSVLRAVPDPEPELHDRPERRDAHDSEEVTRQDG